MNGNDGVNGLHSLFYKEFIILDIEVANKSELIAQMTAQLWRYGIILEQQQFMEDLLRREAEGSTVIGPGTALPHGLSTTVLRPSIMFYRLHNPIDWDDNQEVSLVILLVMSPKETDDRILTAIRNLMLKLADDSFLSALKTKSREALYSLFTRTTE